MKFKTLTVAFFCAFGLMVGLWAEGASGSGASSASARPTSGTAEELEPQVHPEARLLAELDHFYGKLRADYGYQPQGEPLENFVEGAPALTPESLELALRGPLAAATSLVTSVDALEGLIDDLEAGRFDLQAFKLAFSHELRQIESLARAVEKDEYLKLLDFGRDIKSGSLRSGDSIEALRARVSDLGLVARQVRGALNSDRLEDESRIVSLERLSRPSFRTLCQGIESMASGLRSSVEGL